MLVKEYVPLPALMVMLAGRSNGAPPYEITETGYVSLAIPVVVIGKVTVCPGNCDTIVPFCAPTVMVLVTVKVGFMVALTLLEPVTVIVGLYVPAGSPASGGMVKVAEAPGASEGAKVG